MLAVIFIVPGDRAIVRGHPAGVADDGFLAAVPVADVQLRKQARIAEAEGVHAVVVAVAGSKVTTVAQSRSDGIASHLEKVRDIIDQVRHADIVQCGQRTEDIVPYPLAVDVAVGVAQTAHVENCRTDFASEVEFPPEIPGRKVVLRLGVGNRLSLARQPDPPGAVPLILLQRVDPADRCAGRGILVLIVPDCHIPGVFFTSLERRSFVRDVHRGGRSHSSAVPDLLASGVHHADHIGLLKDSTAAVLHFPAERGLARILAGQHFRVDDLGPDAESGKADQDNCSKESHISSFVVSLTRYSELS